jgi:hypothetical protein
MIALPRPELWRRPARREKCNPWPVDEPDRRPLSGPIGVVETEPRSRCDHRPSVQGKAAGPVAQRRGRALRRGEVPSLAVIAWCYRTPLVISDAYSEGILTTNQTNLTNGTGAVWNSPDVRVGFFRSANHSVIQGSVIYSFDS